MTKMEFKHNRSLFGICWLDTHVIRIESLYTTFTMVTPDLVEHMNSVVPPVLDLCPEYSLLKFQSFLMDV